MFTWSAEAGLLWSQRYMSAWSQCFICCAHQVWWHPDAAAQAALSVVASNDAVSNALVDLCYDATGRTWAAVPAVMKLVELFRPEPGGRGSALPFPLDMVSSTSRSPFDEVARFQKGTAGEPCTCSARMACRAAAAASNQHQKLRFLGKRGTPGGACCRQSESSLQRCRWASCPWRSWCTCSTPAARAGREACLQTRRWWPASMSSTGPTTSKVGFRV